MKEQVYGLYRRFGKKKVFWGFYAVLLALMTLLVWGLSSYNNTLQLHGERWRIASRQVQNDGVLLILRGPEKQTMEARYQEHGMPFAYTLTVTGPGREIRLESSLDARNYRFSDRSEFTADHIEVFVGDLAVRDGGSDALTPFQQEEQNLLLDLQQQIQESPALYLVAWVIAALFLLLGCWALFYPVHLWKLQTFMLVDDAEPSAWALPGNQIGGAAVIIIVFVTLLRFFLGQV